MDAEGWYIHRPKFCRNEGCNRERDEKRIIEYGQCCSFECLTELIGQRIKKDQEAEEKKAKEIERSKHRCLLDEIGYLVLIGKSFWAFEYQGEYNLEFEPYEKKFVDDPYCGKIKKHFDKKGNFKSTSRTPGY